MSHSLEKIRSNDHTHTHKSFEIYKRRSLVNFTYGMWERSETIS